VNNLDVLITLLRNYMVSVLKIDQRLSFDETVKLGNCVNGHLPLGQKQWIGYRIRVIIQCESKKIPPEIF